MYVYRQSTHTPSHCLQLQTKEEVMLKKIHNHARIRENVTVKERWEVSEKVELVLVYPNLGEV